LPYFTTENHGTDQMNCPGSRALCGIARNEIPVSSVSWQCFSLRLPFYC